MTDKTKKVLAGNDSIKTKAVEEKTLATLFSQTNLTNYINSTSDIKLGDEHMYKIPKYGLLDLARRLGFKDGKEEYFLNIFRLVDDEEEIKKKQLEPGVAKMKKIYGLGESFSGHAKNVNDNGNVARFENNRDALEIIKLIWDRLEAVPTTEPMFSLLDKKEYKSKFKEQRTQILACIIAAVFPITTLNGNRSLAIYDYDKKYYTFKPDLLSDALVSIVGFSYQNLTKSTLETLESSVSLHYRTIQMPNYMIPLKNGNYNVLTETLEPATFEYATTSRIDTNFVKDAKEPKHYSGMTFEKFISTFCDGHVLRKKLVKQMFASVILGTAPRDGAFIINGPGGDGKSTLVGLLENILGEENVAYLNFRDILEQDRLNTAVNARLIVGSDNDGKLYVNQTSGLKTLITHETQTLSRKYLSAISFKYEGAMIQLTNNLPRFSETGTSMRRRLIGIEAKHSFVKNNDVDRSIETWITDKEVHEYVLSEILTNKNLLQSQYQACDQDMINESLDNDSSIDSFIKDLIRIPHFNVAKYIPASHLYKIYYYWSSKNDAGRQALSKPSFSSQVKNIMTELGFHWENSNESIIEMMGTNGYNYNIWGQFATADVKTELYQTETDPGDGYMLSLGLDKIKNVYRQQAIPEPISKFVYFKLGTLGTKLINFYHKNPNPKYIKGGLEKDKSPYLERLRLELKKGNTNKVTSKINNDVEETTLSVSSFNSISNAINDAHESSIELLISDATDQEKFEKKKSIYLNANKVVQEISKLYTLSQIGAFNSTINEASKNEEVIEKLKTQITDDEEKQKNISISKTSDFLKWFRTASTRNRRKSDKIIEIDKFIVKNPTTIKNSILTIARLLQDLLESSNHENDIQEGERPFAISIKCLATLKDELDSKKVDHDDVEINTLKEIGED